MSHIPSPTAQFPTPARVLRCCKTKRYFTGGGWSEHPSEAQAFSDEIDAARACVTHDLHDIELVLRTELTGVELFSTPVR